MTTAERANRLVTALADYGVIAADERKRLARAAFEQARNAFPSEDSAAKAVADLVEGRANVLSETKLLGLERGLITYDQQTALRHGIITARHRNMGRLEYENSLRASAHALGFTQQTLAEAIYEWARRHGEVRSNDRVGFKSLESARSSARQFMRGEYRRSKWVLNAIEAVVREAELCQHIRTPLPVDDQRDYADPDDGVKITKSKPKSPERKLHVRLLAALVRGDTDAALEVAAELEELNV